MNIYETPFAELTAALEHIRSRRRPAPASRPTRPAQTLAKSMAAFGKMARQQSKLKAQAEGAWLDRLAAGNPTQEDLTKAFAVLDGAIGKIPAAELAGLDLRLRNLQSRAQQESGAVMAKSLVAEINVPQIRRELDALWEAKKITGSDYHLADLKLRNLEALAHAA